jgi:lysophospholipase L1-like esterase
MVGRIVIWTLIGGLLAVGFGDRWFWFAFVAAFWLLGAVCLRRLTPAQTDELRRIVSTTRSARAGLLLAIGILALTGWLFGWAALILSFTMLTSLGLLSVVRRGPEAGLDLVLGLALAGTTIFAAGFAGEWLVSRPAIGAQWGSPAERASQNARFDSLAQGPWKGSFGQYSNLFGFRSPYEQVAKDSGVFRVFALGDSFTWGDMIPRTEDTWPAELERLLQERQAETRIEVINAAVRGYTTANEAELMRRLGWQFQPDVLLVQFLLNDIYPSGPGFQRHQMDDVFGRRRVVPHRFRLAGKARNSALLKFLEEKIERVLSDHDMAPLYEDGTTEWRQLEAALDELGSAAAARDVPAILLIIPRSPSGAFTAESHPGRPLHAKVERAAQRAGFAVLDLTPMFADSAATGREWWATPYDSHPSEAAHGLIARATFRLLVANGVTP